MTDIERVFLRLLNDENTQRRLGNAGFNWIESVAIYSENHAIARFKSVDVEPAPMVVVDYLKLGFEG